MNKLLKLFTLALFATVFFSCDDDPINPKEKTLYETIESNPSFAILKKALDKTGLDETLDDEAVTLTVLAPDNIAFIHLLSELKLSSLDDIPTATLRQVLLNHVLSGAKESQDFSTGYVSVLAKEATTSNPLSMYVNTKDGFITLNGESTVILADKKASNGVLHRVDDVIDLPTVYTFVEVDPMFKKLKQAVNVKEFNEKIQKALRNEKPITVFAPTNKAFKSLFNDLDIKSIRDLPTDAIESVLTYHVVGGVNILSSTLTNDAEVETLNGGKFTVKLDGDSAKIQDANERMANIIAVDVQATNGIVHVLDKVILPAQED